jgi:hypothetical protein
MSSEAENVAVMFWLETEVSTTGGKKQRLVSVGGVESAGTDVSTRTGLMPMAVN